MATPSAVPTSSPTSALARRPPAASRIELDVVGERVPDARRLGQEVRLPVEDVRRPPPTARGRRRRTRSGGHTARTTRPHRGHRSSVLHGAGRHRARPSTSWPRSASRTSVIFLKNPASSRVSMSRCGPRSTSTTWVMRPGRGDITTTRSGQVHGLGDRVGHEHHAGAGLGADPQQLGLHVLAGHLVQRAERLVHQQQRRVGGERPGDGDALLHAAGQLPRPVLGEVGQLDQARASPAPAARRFALSQPFSSSGSSTFLTTVRQSKRPACWKAMPYSWSRRACPRRLAVDGDRARRRLDEVGDQPQQRRLPAPRRSDQADELARRRRRGRRRRARRPAVACRG